MNTVPAPGSLVIEVEGRRYVVPPGAQWLIGRSAEASIRLTDERLSRRHALILPAAAGWRLVDAGSSNGIYHRGQRTAELIVNDDVTVQLGAQGGVEMLLRVVPASRPAAGPPPTGRPPPQLPPQADDRPTGEIGPELSSVHALPDAVVRIGRVATNDIVLDDLLVSRRHAEVRRTAAGTQIVDLGSGNGTFVNGQRVTQAMLTPGTLVTIGRHSLRFDGQRLAEYVDRGDVSFAASGVTVDLPGGRRILDNVSFNLGPRNLLAIVGPSGAGKSTLLGALTGFRPASYGAVLYAGRDLYANYDDLRQRIGLVPQQDILHQALTLKQALGYGAKLRFPADVSAAERAGRVTEVIGELSLSQQTDTRISSMSGGERKRASTALELLTKPSLLFLDEPTSGLDADLDRDVMNKLRQLADEGRTVVVVTHNLEHLEVCDLVMVLARGGYVAYLGPPAGALAYFRARSWADAFGRLKTRPGADWALDFTHFPERDRRSQPPPRLPPGPARGPVLTPIRRQSVGAQLATLCRRYLAVIAADKAYLGIIVALPFILALFARVVPAEDGLAPATQGVNGGARQLLLVLAVGATLMGLASAVRELVKERAIYRRERAIGLSSIAYLGSKLAVLGVVAVIQGIVLTLLSIVGRAKPEDASLLPSPTLELVIAIATLSAVSAAVGLVVSAVVRDENQAMPILVLLTMAQLVLCGGLVPVAGRVLLAQLSWLVPTRWGFAAVASTSDLNNIEASADPDSLWKHSAVTWFADYTLLMVLGILAVGATWLLIRRLDPNRR